MLCLSLLFALRSAHADDVSGPQVKRALARGVDAIKARQGPEGTWAEHYSCLGGETCLATLALLVAGQPVDSPAVSAALSVITRIPNRDTYVVSLKAMVLSQADPKRYQRDIHAAARWLIGAQFDVGLWGYTEAPGPFDNSNSQFALLGLHAAAQAGVDVPAGVWHQARVRVLALQNKDGGWSYRNDPRSFGSMTAAGVSDLIILGSNVATAQEKGFRDGVAPNCGKYAGNRPLINGLNWIGRNFKADGNPQHGRQYIYYWLYAVERCGILSGRRHFGEHDWYREGARFLVDNQDADGTWGAGIAEFSDTCLAVMFLAKGHKPLLAQKLQWSEDETWNPDRHDLENLVGFIGDKLGEPTTWQTVTFDAPLEDWLAAPLLYIQGHSFPNWGEKQREKLRRYVEQGGTLLAEACCGAAAFRQGFEGFARAAFAESPLRELDAGHPLYSAHFDLKPSGLMGIDLGCRTSVIYSPNDLSCLWEQADVPVQSEQALKLGTNIAAFALGRQVLRDRLDVVTLPSEPRDTAAPPRPAPGGALRLAQAVYSGDWRPDAKALVRLAEFLRDNLQLDVVTQYATPHIAEDELSASPVLFMTGHYAFDFSQSQRAALVSYLRRGGFLLAEACCGRAEFDVSFRKLAQQAFPGEPLKRLPPDHALFRGEPGFRLRNVGYKPSALAERPELEKPELWGIEIEGRLALVYSPFSLGCGLDGHRCFNCRGLVDDDARRLAANVVLYALTH